MYMYILLVLDTPEKGKQMPGSVAKMSNTTEHVYPRVQYQLWRMPVHALVGYTCNNQS